MENPIRARAVDFAIGMAGLVLLAFLAYSIAERNRLFSDNDIDYLYLGSWAWAHHIAPYGHVVPRFALAGSNLTSDNFANPGYYFPPFCAMLFAPLTYLPLASARLILLYGQFAILLAGIWRISDVSLPTLRPPHRLFLIGVSSLAAPFKWLLYLEQPSALFIGFVLLFGAEVMRRRWTASGVLGVLVGIKLSLFLPVVGLYLWHKKYGMLLGVIALLMTLNVLAASYTGLAPTMQRFVAEYRGMNGHASLDRPSALSSIVTPIRQQPASPLYPLLGGLGKRTAYELNYAFLFSAWTRSVTLAVALGWAASLASLAALLYVIRKASDKSHTDPAYELQLYSTLCTLSLLIVYHGKYDLVLLVPGIMSALGLLIRSPANRAARVSFAVGVFLTFVINATMLNNVFGWLVVPHAWVILIPILSYLLIVVFAAQLVMLAACKSGTADELKGL